MLCALDISGLTSTVENAVQAVTSLLSLGLVALCPFVVYRLLTRASEAVAGGTIVSGRGNDANDIVRGERGEWVLEERMQESDRWEETWDSAPGGDWAPDDNRDDKTIPF